MESQFHFPTSGTRMDRIALQEECREEEESIEEAGEAGEADGGQPVLVKDG